MTRPASVPVNGREHTLPARPPAVIAVDGCEPAYLDDALTRSPGPPPSKASCAAPAWPSAP